MSSNSQISLGNNGAQSGMRPSPEALADAQLVLPMDTGRPVRIGLTVLVLGLGGFLTWAALAPLDEGVPAPGMVTIDTKRKPVQHPAGGIVREVEVREGQQVKAGDILMRLDDVEARATYESLRQHYLTLRATEGRLAAEKDGATRVTFHNDLHQAASDPWVITKMADQEQLFQSRRSALQAELEGLTEGILGREAQLQGHMGMLDSRKRQLELLREELKGVADMVREGYLPRSRQMDLERSVAETTGFIADLHGQIASTKRSIAELKLRAGQRTLEYRKEVETQLAEIRREVEADADKVRAAGDILARIAIRAPAEGQVVGLAVQTVGAVISPGQKLMDIVPGDEPLLLETRVQPHMIDRVRPGLEADVRFSAFAHSPQLVVTSKVVSVSADLLTDPQTGEAFYLARVEITPEGMQQLGNRQLQPGMPAEVIFRTGERTVLTYLLHPLTKRIAAAMTEE